MEVHSLVMHVSDSDLTALAAKLLADDSPLENVSVQIDEAGVTVRGVYPLLVNVTFESGWQIRVEAGKVSANLCRLKAFGMPAMVFKSAILKALAEIASKEYWVDVQGERVQIDIDYLISRDACPTRLNLSSVTCRKGSLVIEARKRSSTDRDLQLSDFSN